MPTKNDERAVPTGPPPKPVAPWAFALLMLPSEADEPARRQAVLRLIKDRDFAPATGETLAIRQVAGPFMPALNWVDPVLADYEIVRRELLFLQGQFSRLSSSVRTTEIARIRELIPHYPHLRRYLDQLDVLHRLRRGFATSAEGEDMRERSMGWMLKTPTPFANERFQWFDANPDQNRILLSILKSDALPLLKEVPGLGHYLNPEEFVVEESGMAKIRREEARRVQDNRQAMKTPIQLAFEKVAVVFGGLVLIVISFNFLLKMPDVPNRTPPYPSREIDRDNVIPQRSQSESNEQFQKLMIKMLEESKTKSKVGTK